MGLSAPPAAYVLAGFLSCVLGLAGFSNPAANLSMAASADPSLLASFLAASSHAELQARRSTCRPHTKGVQTTACHFAAGCFMVASIICVVRAIRDV